MDNRSEGGQGPSRQLRDSSQEDGQGSSLGKRKRSLDFAAGRLPGAEASESQKGAHSLIDQLLNKIGKSVSYKEFIKQLDKRPSSDFFSTDTGKKWIKSDRGTDFLYKHGRDFLKTEQGKGWFEDHGPQWIGDHLYRTSPDVLKPFIELIERLPTEELNKRLVACDKDIEQLRQDQEKSTGEKELEIRNHMIDIYVKRDAYWEVLKERGKKGQLRPENRSYYDQQRKEDLSEDQKLEKLVMESEHASERNEFIKESLKKQPYKHSLETMNPHLRKEFVNSRNPELLRHQERKEKELQEKHEKNMQEIQSLSSSKDSSSSKER